MAKAAGAKAPVFKIPTKLGDVVDLLYTTKQARLAAGKVAAEFEEREKLLKEHLIQNLPKSNASGIAGKLARATIETKKVPTTEDWEAFYKYIKKTGRFDLLQRRLAEGAVKEMWDDGKKVPGVGVFNAVTVSLNKV